jgi:hypothetical protein
MVSEKGEALEIARWLRQWCDVPIVFATLYGDADTVERIHEQVSTLLQTQSQ